MRKTKFSSLQLGEWRDKIGARFTGWGGENLRPIAAFGPTKLQIEIEIRNGLAHELAPRPGCRNLGSAADVLGQITSPFCPAKPS
jgi:hypothetical protein